MTTKIPKPMVDALYQLTGEDLDATLFMADIWYLSQVWDDCIDGDAYDMNEVFMIALSKIPQNNFYRRYMRDLTPIINQCIMDWKTANVLEQRQEGEDLNRAYMLRASPYRLFHYCLLLIHGMDEAIRLGPELWSIYGESLDDFLLEMKHA